MIKDPAPIEYKVTSIQDLLTKHFFPDVDDETLEKERTAFKDEIIKYCKDFKCYIPRPDKKLAKVTTKINYSEELGAKVGDNAMDKVPTNPMMIVKKVTIRYSHDINAIKLTLSDGIETEEKLYHGGYAFFLNA